VKDLAQKVSNQSFFELKDGGIVLGLSRCHPATQPSIGVDIIYEHKRLQPVTACVFTDEDAQLAAPPGLSQHLRSLPSIFSTLPLATSASASGNNFNFNFNFAQPRPRSTFRANTYWADSKPTSRRVARQALNLLSVVLRSIHPTYPFISYADPFPQP
jgi:hypothetical protein